MSRYIDADELIFFGLDNPDDEHLFEFVPKEFIDNAPTADVVEVVRCKDCVYYENFLCGRFSAYGNSVEEPEYDYCSYGERREDAEAVNTKN